MSSSTGEPTTAGQQNLSLMLLANDLLSKALDMRCTDFQIEPDREQVIIRYLRKGETVKETQLPMSVHSELVFCYKVLAGLNIKEAKRPQDHNATIELGDHSVNMRVTAIPGEYGEMIALSFKFSE